MTAGESNTLNPCALSGGAGTSSDCNASTRKAERSTQADARPIPGCPPGYFVQLDPAAPHGVRVFSSVHRRFWGKGWRAVAVDKEGKVRLPVLTDGRVVYRRRSVKTVARAAFGEEG